MTLSPGPIFPRVTPAAMIRAAIAAARCSSTADGRGTFDGAAARSCSSTSTTASRSRWTCLRPDQAVGHLRPQLRERRLRRVPPERWTVSARRDVLTPAQHTDLAEAAYYRYPLDVDEANALLAAYRLGHTPAGLHFALAEVTALLVLSG